VIEAFRRRDDLVLEGLVAMFLKIGSCGAVKLQENLIPCKGLNCNRYSIVLLLLVFIYNQNASTLSNNNLATCMVTI